MKSPEKPRPSAAARVLILFIRAYQRLLSPMLGHWCRFYPSCSVYSRQAFATRPFLEACKLSLWRIARCNPFHPGGYDPLDEDPPQDQSPQESPQAPPESTE